MKNIKRYSIICSCLLLAVSPLATGAATIYKKVDAQGNVTFTDVPPRAQEAAETIDLDSLNSFTPNAANDQAQEVGITPSEEASAESAAHEYAALQVTSPANDASVRANAGNLTVTARVEPALANNHALRLMMDGSPVAASNQTGTFTLVNVDRGTHQLQAQVVNDDGDVVFAGQPSVFHMLRFSQQNPANAR